MTIPAQLDAEILYTDIVSAPFAEARESATVSERPERFVLSASRREVVRLVRRRDGSVSDTTFPLGKLPRKKHLSQADLAELTDESFLLSKDWPVVDPGAPCISVVDIFSSCGIMSLGVWEAARALGMRLRPVMALDVNSTALDAYKSNFPDATVTNDPVEHVLDGGFGKPATDAEQRFAGGIGQIDLLIGGPPCQGHSNLNNHTRRDDPKNRLYERMARFAELVRPRNIIIENVPAVLHDKGHVVDDTIGELLSLGYAVDSCIAEVSSLGVPQRRRRHVLVASLAMKPNVGRTLSLYTRRAPPVSWAIRDLDSLRKRDALDLIGKASQANRNRMAWLFKHGKHDLPDRLRPKCHREKEHSYKSVYGRMYWDRPSQTVTSGFTSMGQGRFVHPRKPRTITPHEAARLQFIPDFFQFGNDLRRTVLAEMIGNAVPLKLTYVLALELFR